MPLYEHCGGELALASDPEVTGSTLSRDRVMTTITLSELDSSGLELMKCITCPHHGHLFTLSTCLPVRHTSTESIGAAMLH